MNQNTTYTRFRTIAKAEGISFLLLLFIAMPLKYFGGMPMAVRIMGSIHGGLFIAFMIWMYLVNDQYNRGTKWMGKAFLASIVPFGTFIMDKQWKLESSGDGGKSAN